MSVLDVGRVGDAIDDEVVPRHVGSILLPPLEKDIHKLLGQLLPFFPGKDPGRAREFLDVQRALPFGYPARVPDADKLL